VADYGKCLFGRSKHLGIIDIGRRWDEPAVATPSPPGTAAQGQKHRGQCGFSSLALRGL